MKYGDCDEDCDDDDDDMEGNDNDNDNDVSDDDMVAHHEVLMKLLIEMMLLVIG